MRERADLRWMQLRVTGSSSWCKVDTRASGLRYFVSIPACAAISRSLRK